MERWRHGRVEQLPCPRRSLAPSAGLARAWAIHWSGGGTATGSANRETWDADAAEPISDFLDAADRVVVRFVWRGRGHGPAYDMQVTCVYTVRSGRIIAFSSSGTTRTPSKPWGCWTSLSWPVRPC